VTRTIIITSGKDGVGKTNICINTALEISHQNFRICLFDANLGLAKANILSGLQPDHNLDNFIFGDKRLDEIILHSSRDIDILPGSSDIEKIAHLGKKKIPALISSFSQLTSYDYFIIDTSSGISKSLIAFCLSSTETFLVITSEATSLTEAYLLLRVMSLNGYRGTVRIIVNKCPSIPISKRTYLRFETVVNKRLNMKMDLAGIILNDPNIEAAAKNHKALLTLFPNSIASQCIRAMVSTLLENNTEAESRTDFGRFWQHYFDFIQSDLVLTADPIENGTTESSLPSAVHHNVREYSSARIIPFAHSGGTINSLKLASPVTLLSKSFELQTKGELSQKELLKIFSSDPALMVRAMQMFGSSRTSGSNRITRMSQIFKNLGKEALSNLLATASMQRALTDQIVPDNHFLNSFWHHSYKSALLAEQLAKTIDYPYPEEAFLAGLIHDIGRLALQSEYPQVYAQFPHTLRDREIVIETEKLVFGRTHAQIGAEALQVYRLNSFIIDAVHYHTESELRIKTGFDLVKIVFIACRSTPSSQENIKYISELGASLFGLKPYQLAAAIETADEKLTEIADYFHIPPAEETGNSDTENTQAHLRLQAVDYSILQSALPSPVSVKETPQAIRLIHQGLDILFGFKPAFCFIPDERQSSLQVVGYPDCFEEEILSDILISLHSENSLIVEAFTSSELQISTDSNPLSLADEQITRILGSQILVSVPMVARAVTKGVIVFGIKKEELPAIYKQQKRLQQFGARSANTLFAAEQFLKAK